NPTFGSSEIRGADALENITLGNKNKNQRDIYIAPWIIADFTIEAFNHEKMNLYLGFTPGGSEIYRYRAQFTDRAQKPSFIWLIESTFMYSNVRHDIHYAHF
ncbi:hypothetical protein ACJX0J_032112, partial [Zea mays]